MAKKFTLGFLAGLIVGLAVSFFLFSGQSVPERTTRLATDGEEKTSLMVDTGENIIICSDLEVNENPSVFDLLNNCAEEKNFEVNYQTYEGVGVLVTEIAGEKMDDSRFWQFWVNNEYSQISADNFPIEGGDVVMWKLTGASLE